MRKSILPGIVLMPCLAFSPVLLSACGDAQEDANPVANGSLNVSVTSALGNFDSVSSIHLSITETDASGNDIAGPWTYSRDLQRNGNVWTTSVGGIPVGHYRVVAQARNSSGEALFEGDDSVHIESDDNFLMTLIMQEEFDETVDNRSPLFLSVTANKANVNHDEELEIRVGATDPDGIEGLSLTGGTADGVNGSTAYFKRIWTPESDDEGDTSILLELTDADGNSSAMNITVFVGGTGSLDATMVVNLAPHITSLVSNVDTSGGANAQGHYTSTILSLGVTDGDYYHGDKGEASKRQDDLTYAWKIANTEACTGSFNGQENGTFNLTHNGTTNGANSETVDGTSDVKFTLQSINDPANCWLEVEVTDQWLGKATAQVQVDTSRVQPFFVPNLQLSIQSHDTIENPSGFTSFDKLQFEVYADGVPDGQDANIDWEWSIGGTPIPHYENSTADDILDALQDWLDDAIQNPQDIDAFGAWLGLNDNGQPCGLNFACIVGRATNAISAVAGTSWDLDDARAYSELRWWTWQKYPCFSDADGIHTYAEVTASANGVSDTIRFDIDVAVDDADDACSSINGL